MGGKVSQVELKVFVMSDSEWWAAETAESAVLDMCNEYGWTPEEAKEEEYINFPVLALSDEDLDELVVIGSDDAPISFRAQLAKLVADGHAFPTLFASTEC
jgi:hypothetical protein